MATNCEACPLRELDTFQRFSEGELRFVGRLKVGELVVEPEAQLLVQGSHPSQIYTVLSGMGIRYKNRPDGRRQVLNFVMPGDLLGLQAQLMGEMSHSVSTATQMTLCVFDRREFWDYLKSHHEKAFNLSWVTASEEHFLGASLGENGQRDARQRLAWSLAWVYQRGSDLKLLDEHGAMPFPFKQQHFADALGLSLVHTNKSLAKLRQMGVATWLNGELIVQDFEQLCEIGLYSRRQGQRPLL